jgi:hypothetical protein
MHGMLKCTNGNGTERAFKRSWCNKRCICLISKESVTRFYVCMYMRPEGKKDSFSTSGRLTTRKGRNESS